MGEGKKTGDGYGKKGVVREQSKDGWKQLCRKERKMMVGL
jgi:hypothetical protein